MPIAAPPPPVHDPVFRVSRLSLAFPATNGQPAREVLRDVSVEVPRGGALTFVGPSGAGKSTLLRCLNRLEEPPPGTVSFEGRDVTALDPLDLRRRVALVMQAPVVFEGTVRDNLCTQPRAARLDLSDARLGALLEEVGLERAFLDRDAALLSGGEKQRVTVARALLGDPQALLLDEPTSALDPPNAALVAEAVERLRRSRGLTVVAVTHQAELLRRLGGCFLYLVAGRTQVYECIDDAAHAITDTRLQAFLAGESPEAVAART
jgi:ABC-type methionine transport system ATPase subunit